MGSVRGGVLAPAMSAFGGKADMAGDGTVKKKARTVTSGRAVRLYRLEGCALISSRRSLTRARA